MCAKITLNPTVFVRSIFVLYLIITRKIRQLKKAAKTEMDAMVEATEAQALATADVARALVIRQHAEIEIREAHSKNDILQAEISKVSVTNNLASPMHN